MKLENKFEFLENRLCGKFVTQTEEKSLDWNSLKEHDILDFSWVEFPDIEDENIPLYIITGKGGVGKTTYLVYWLEKCLLSDESWIKNVIFLNPTKETFFHKEEIFEELQFFTKGTPINPDNLIIAIDALYRKNDNDQDLKEKFKVIKEIINNDYKVILTIKDIHLKKLENEVPDGYNIWKHELTPTIESTKLILRNWMKFYEVKSSFQE